MAGSLGIPLLIPGVGVQGGSSSEVMAALGDPRVHRVNVSSAVLYAGEGDDFAAAAARAARRFAAELAVAREPV